MTQSVYSRTYLYNHDNGSLNFVAVAGEFASHPLPPRHWESSTGLQIFLTTSTTLPVSLEWKGILVPSPRIVLDIPLRRFSKL